MLRPGTYRSGEMCLSTVYIAIKKLVPDYFNFPDPRSVRDYFQVSSVYTSEYTYRDFIFAPIQVTDNDNLLHVNSTREFGVIKVKLWRVRLDGVMPVQPHRLRPEVTVTDGQHMDNQMVHERSKKAGTHCTRFGEEHMNISERVVDRYIVTRRLDPEPFLTFEFKYKPMDVLMADGIVPRPLHPNPGFSVPPKEEELEAETSSASQRLNAVLPQEEAESAGTSQHLYMPSIKEEENTQTSTAFHSHVYMPPVKEEESAGTSVMSQPWQIENHYARINQNQQYNFQRSLNYTHNDDYIQVKKEED